MITRTTTRWTYAPNGVSTSFPFDNLVLAAGDLLVNCYGADGTPIALPSHVVSGVGVPTGGSIDFSSPPASNASARIVIQRATLATQEGGYEDFMQESADVREGRQDRLTALAQEALARDRRVIAFNPLDLDGPMVLPPVALRAGGVLGFDALGNPTVFQNVPLSPTLAVAPYMQAALLKPSALELLQHEGFSNYVASLVGAADAGALLGLLTFSPFSANLPALTTAAAWRAALGLQDYSVGSTIASADTLDLDSTAGGQVPGDERAISGVVPVNHINGTQPRVRLVSLTDGVQLNHTADIISRTTSPILMRAGDTVTLVRTAGDVWRETEFQGNPSRRSALLAGMVAGATVGPLPHYLGKRVGAVHLCGREVDVAGDLGWMPADFASNGKIELCTTAAIGGNGYEALVDDTNVTLRLGTGGLAVLAKGTNVYTLLAPAKWEFWLEIDPRS